MRHLFSRVRPFVVSLGAGLLLGLVGPVAGKWHGAVFVAVSAVFSGGWPWAGYAFLVGCFRRSRIESALVGSLGLAVAVVAYYLFKDASPAVPHAVVVAGTGPGASDGGASDGGVSPGILAWGTAAFVFGAPLGYLGNLARLPGVVGLACRLVVPVVALCETSMRLTAESAQAGPVVRMTWSVVQCLAVAVALALVGATIRNRRHGRGARTPSEAGVRT